MTITEEIILIQSDASNPLRHMNGVGYVECVGYLHSRLCSCRSICPGTARQKSHKKFPEKPDALVALTTYHETQGFPDRQCRRQGVGSSSGFRNCVSQSRTKCCPPLDDPTCIPEASGNAVHMSRQTHSGHQTTNGCTHRGKQ